jgi:hypothetical protein
MGETTCSNVTTTPADSQCYASYLAFHITKHATAYLEGLWVWLADHDLDGENKQITLYSGRGILSESQGPVWMIGTACESSIPFGCKKRKLNGVFVQLNIMFCTNTVW